MDLRNSIKNCKKSLVFFRFCAILLKENIPFRSNQVLNGAFHLSYNIIVTSSYGIILTEVTHTSDSSCN